MLKTHFLTRVGLKDDEIDSYEKYPLSLPFLKTFDGLNFHPSVTYLVGENGTGKSTLLEALAVSWGFNAEGGSINFSFSTVETQSSLHEYLRVSRGLKKPRGGFFFRAESFYNVASEVDRLSEEGGGFLDYYGGKSLHDQSHGESFFSLFMNRFRGGGLYILDEPEAALSPDRQLSFLVRLHELVEGGAQFVIATHSPILMSYPNSEIHQIDEHGIELIDFEETAHFQTTKNFLNNHELMIKNLTGISH